jgi:hypothetical protein
LAGNGENVGLTGQGADISQRIVDALLDCENVPEYRELRSIVDSAIEETVRAGCSAVEEYCSLDIPVPGLPFSPGNLTGSLNTSLTGCNITTCNSATLRDFTDLATIGDPILGCPTVTIDEGLEYGTTCTPLQDPCPAISGSPNPPAIVCEIVTRTLADCVTQCSLPETRDIALRIRQGTKGLGGLLVIVETLLIPFLDCTRITDAIFKVKDAVCVTLT